ncbi:MAG: PAS domain S-box protein [Psychroserpens sp.]|uniref:sensor histidine kinase n=1 Tax=Psychroserpens sp. TaxID=2020870 RepID=UPI003C74592E
MNAIERYLLSSEEEPSTGKNITFLNSIQDSIAIGSWEADLQNMQIKWSAMTRKIHEVSDDYKPTFDEAINFYPEGENRDRILEVFDKAVKTGIQFDERLQFVSAKNNLKWVRSIGYPIFENNECVKIRGIFQDITQSKTTSNLIALREEEARTSWDHSPNGMAIIGLDAKLKKANLSLCHFLEYTEDELIGLNFTHLTHPDDKHLESAQVMEMFEGTRHHFEVEKRYISRTGNIVPCLVTVSMLRDKDKKPVHFIANLANISNIKKAEQKIKTLLETTEEQNMRLLNFAHIVSHNLRSHSGNLEMLLDLIKQELPETTDNEYFPLVNDAVKHLSETIHNLNEVSSINTKINNDFIALNLLEFINKAIGSIAAQIIETNTNFTVDVDDTIEILGIAAYLDSILLNFFTNAIKYRQPNQNPVVQVSASREANGIKLIIEDNGLGIDLEKHGHKIFGMYKTFHKHDDARGLGLFITKNQIDAIGGSVDVTSAIGIGTKFTVHFKCV